MLFNLDFAYNIILLRSFFSLIIDLYILIPEVIVQVFNPNAEIVIPIGIPSKEAKTEIEIHSITTEAKIRECSIECSIAQTYTFFNRIF